MKVYRSVDPHQRKSALKPLSPGGPKLNRINGDTSPSVSNVSTPLQPLTHPDSERDVPAAARVEATPRLWQQLDAISEWISSTRQAAHRSVQVPVWAAASLIAVLLMVSGAVGYTQLLDPGSTAESRPAPSNSDGDPGEEASARTLNLLEIDLDEDPGDPPVWQEPGPSGISQREEFMRSDGFSPERREDRYSAEEIERLQAELEAIQRNSAQLRSLARQQSGDLSAAYSSLEATQEQKDGALEDLQGRIAELEGRIQTVDELARELRDMLGLPELQSGVGGPSGDSSSTNGDPWLTLRADIVAIEQRAGELVYDLDEVNTEIQLRLAQVQQTGLPNGGSVEENLQFYDTMPVGMPVDGPVTSRFGLRTNPFGPGNDMHTGIDIAARNGTSVRATGGGTVRVASDQGGYGLLVIIDHGRGVSTWYGHNSRFRVSPGQSVNAGDVIAEVGSTGMSTGPHVHYEIRIDNVPQDPLSLMMMDR